MSAAAGAEVRPGLDQVRRLAVDHDLIGVVRTIPAGEISGPTMLAAFGDRAGAFLFESATGEGEFARFTFAGVAGPERFAVRQGVLTRMADLDAGGEPCPDPLQALQQFAAGRRVVGPPDLEVPFAGGAVGFLAYEAVAAYELIPRPSGDPLGLPDAWFGLCLTCAILDRQDAVVHLVTHVEGDADLASQYAAAGGRLEAIAAALLEARTESAATASASCPPLGDEVANLSRDDFLGGVARCLEYIAAGDIFQVQVSRRFSLPFSAPPHRLYTALRSLNPSPYMFYLRCDDCVLVGTSPEMLVRVGADGRVDYHPIAGTRRRGRSAEEDAAMERQLHDSEKEQAEHLMLVDLGRNDVGRVCETGSVSVHDYAAVRRYANVMHLETSIEGRLQRGLSAVDALRACFPAGTVTGAPKVRAMEIIAELEPEVRGAYAGAVGYLDFQGNLDTAIALRTAVIREGVVHLQAAAGIVADSTAAEEAGEIDNKLQALVRAVRSLQQPVS